MCKTPYTLLNHVNILNISSLVTSTLRVVQFINPRIIDPSEYHRL